MDITTVIWETAGMMGFTFLVGMGVAYFIKMLVGLFLFFRAGNVSSVIKDYKSKLAYQRQRRNNMKKLLLMMEQNSDVELLKYLHENKDTHNTVEQVDDLYNFYKGIYKDQTESEGINDLIKYYNGEV